MSRKYKFHDNDKLYFISYATVYWIDVFIREEYNQVIIDSWKHCQEKTGFGNLWMVHYDEPCSYDYWKQTGQVGRHYS